MRNFLGRLRGRSASQPPVELTERERRHALVGPAKLWEMKRDFQLQFLKSAGLKPHHTLADIGCGTLRGGAALIEYLEPGHYVGLEARPDVLDEGRRELEELGLQDRHPTLIASAELAAVALDRRFDFVWSFSVFIHMADDVLNDALRFTARRLADRGVAYANVNIGRTYNGSWREFPYVVRPLDFYRDAASRHGLTFTDCGALEDLGHRSHDPAQDRQRMLKFERAPKN